MAKKPWGLLEASSYLLDWVARNQASVCGAPPTLRFMMEDDRVRFPPLPAGEVEDMPDGWADFAVGAPRVVVVQARACDCSLLHALACSQCLGGDGCNKSMGQ